MRPDAFFCQEATLYNHYRLPGERTDRWQRTVLRGVMWREEDTREVTGEGMARRRRRVLTIPLAAEAGGRTYLPPERFALAGDGRAEHFTLDAAGGQDLLVAGDCPREMDEEGLRDLRHGIARIAGVRDNTGARRLGHWRVEAI